LARLMGTARLFSTTAAPQFPKLKTHQGAKKRWRSMPSGVFKRGRSGRGHLNVSKTPSRINALGQPAYSSPSQTARLKKILPYGS
ncbi:uncharacterized protein BXZ73DRAFT_20433, partial [Epithele typhae]|uniref:uncharacterized protein n=1 Tax=Epithele typhae TaxID=378194 RepID=UPI00200829B1